MRPGPAQERGGRQQRNETARKSPPPHIPGGAARPAPPLRRKAMPRTPQGERTARPAGICRARRPAGPERQGHGASGVPRHKKRATTGSSDCRPGGFEDGLRPKHRLRLRFSRRRPGHPHRRYPARCRRARSTPRRRPRPRWWSSDAACSSRRSRRPARWR